MLSRSARRSLATHANLPTLQQKSNPSLIPPYSKLQANLKIVNTILGDAPLTLAEKILYSHLDNVEAALAGKKHADVRGKAYLKLRPDRVAMQDASAQMALLQFSTCGADRTAVPSSVHCDHLISAYAGAEADLKVCLSSPCLVTNPEGRGQRAVVSNKEVFDFLESASRKYGIEFWRRRSCTVIQTRLIYCGE